MQFSRLVMGVIDHWFNTENFNLKMYSLIIQVILVCIQHAYK